MSYVYTATRIHRILARCVLSCCLIFTSLGVQSAVADSTTLQWASNSESDLTGYKVYQGLAPGSYGLPIDVGNTTTYTAQNLQAGLRYYFAITAYDRRGNESSPSIEVSRQISAPYSKATQLGLISPRPGSRLANSTETFSWTGNGVEKTKWWLHIGTRRGLKNIYNSGPLGHATDVTVSGLSTNAAALYVRLWYWQGNGWKFLDARYLGS